MNKNYLILLLLFAVMVSCQNEQMYPDPNREPGFPAQGFQISLTDNKGKSILDPSDDIVILSYQGEDFLVDTEERTIHDTGSCYKIEEKDHVEDGLYCPRYDVMLSFPHNQWKNWKMGDVIFSISVNGKIYNAVNEEIGVCIDGIVGVLEREPNLYHGTGIKYYRIQVDR